MLNAREVSKGKKKCPQRALPFSNANSCIVNSLFLKLNKSEVSLSVRSSLC